MKIAYWTKIVALTTASALFAATTEPIGAINVAGNVRMNGIETAGHATINDGATLETGTASGDINLAGGAHLVLGTTARAQVYRGRMMLLQGSAQLDGAAGYSLDARGMRVVPSDSSAAIVLTTTDQGLRVGTLRGKAQLLNEKGTLLAWVPQGTSLSVNPQAGTPSPVMHVQGKVFVQDGRYYLVDATTGVKFELEGSNLKSLAGKVVEVAGPGTTPPAGSEASYLITVTSSHAVGGAGVAGAGFLGGTKTVIAGLVIAGAGTATGIVKATQSATPLSH
jgi:hypothetical protein